MAKKLIARGQATIHTQSDAYTINQSINEYVFPAASNGTITNAVTVSSAIKVTLGDRNITSFSIGAITKPNGFSDITVDDTQKKVTYSVAANTTNLADSGLVSIPVIIKSETYYISFVWSKAKDGASGNNGQDACSVSLSRNSYVVPADKSGNLQTAVTVTTVVSASKGSTAVTPTIGTLPAVPGCSLSKSGTTVTIIFTAGTSLAESGVIDIPATADGKNVTLGFSYAKARTGTDGPAGIDANMLDWVKDWDTNKTLIGANSVITPKIFAGVKNTNGTLTGMAIGKFSLNTLNASGSVISESIEGIYGFKDGYKTFYIDNAGNAQLGKGDQFIKYNSASGKIEFGAEVSLNWVNAVNTAKNEAIITAATDATGKVNALKPDIYSASVRKIRYIRDWLNGSSSNSDNHWVQIKALDSSGNNVALNKAVSGGATDKRITNGNTETTPYVTAAKGLNSIVVDLGAAYDIENVQVWHYYGDGRTYNETRTEASLDASNWITLFDSAREGKYKETSSGRTYYVKSYEREFFLKEAIGDALTCGLNAANVAEAISKKANEEKWGIKLTYIDSTGIFTGTLSANTVNAVKINASQITAGTIDAARINVDALKASLITAANINALTLAVSKGTVGGWTIDGDSVFIGTKNNTAAAYTSASGSVTIGSNGIRGFKWRLDSTGAGAIAGGNISWDASGNVTFASSVSLSWTTGIDNITTALGGSSHTKLTKLDASGIYTGSLIASQITAGTINTDRLDAASIKSNIINVSYINGLSCTFDKGKIGGWTIGADTITIGSIGTVGAIPLQIRSSSTGSGNWFNGAYKPYGLSMLWYQSSNAGHFVFGQVAATGSTVKTGFIGIQMMAWDNTEYFCLSARHDLSGSKEVYNRIAGWAFDNSKIWKNNISLGADGSITNGSLWKLNNDGSGQLANGNITWNAAGAVTFASSVSLNWTGAADNALASAKTYADTKKTEAVNTAAADATTKMDSAKSDGILYCKGTGMSRNANKVLSVSGKNIYNTTGRGLQLTVIKRSDLSTVSDTLYDVYGVEAKRTELANALNALDDTVIVAVVSYDAISIDAGLSAAMARCGGSGIILTYRNPYALVGIPGIGKGNGIEVYQSDAATAPFAEITTKIANGIPQGLSSINGRALTLTDNTLTALGGSTYAKLTKIDSTGIYTGTLNASQVTAGTISADRIAAGTITADKLNVSSVQASVVTATAVNALTCAFTKGTIGGWTIGADTITIGSIGTAGAVPVQLRSVSSGSGYVYSGQYKPYGLTLTWHQSNNAGHFVFGQVMSAGNAVKTGFVGIQMMAWDNTEYFCLSANSVLSGSKEVYNRIAGWAFDSDSIYRGTKNNTSGAYTGAPGEITIGSNGIRGFKWRLDSTGAGTVAAGNISWDASGNVTFGSSVSLNWTNAANSALSSAQAYADTKKTEAINTAATDATNKANAAKELAQAMAFGRMLYRDPAFYNGNNGIGVYNNSNNGTVTVTRTADTNAPNDSKQSLVIKNTGTSSPNCGGFFWGTATSYRKVFITRIIAKIPAGRDISYHSNSIGTGGSQKWLTPVAGTGDWCEYICKVTCGTANFSSTHFFAVSGDVGTAESPVEWRLAYATVLDVTSTEKYTTTIDANGIYTGTIQAGQVLVDSALVVGGSTYNGSISVRDASNVVKVTLDRTGITAVGGTIGGWVISPDQISRNSVILGSDGSITNGTKWKLNNDGSGQVANGNVSWTAAGAVTITATVNATSGQIGGFEIAYGRIGSVASGSGTGGGLAIYDNLFRVGSSSSFVLFGDDTFPASAGGAFTATGRVTNNKYNSYYTNCGIYIDVNNAFKNYGIYSNAALLAPVVISNKIKTIVFGSGSYSIDFSQNNLFFVYGMYNIIEKYTTKIIEKYTTS